MMSKTNISFEPKSFEKIHEMYLPIWFENIHVNQNQVKKSISSVTLEVYNQLSSISNTISNLERVKVFLENPPEDDWFEKNDISGTDYYMYHMDVFFHKISTLLDIKRYLVNLIYEMGFKNKECSWDSIKENLSQSNAKSFNILNNFFSTFKKELDNRNVSSHEGRFPDILTVQFKTLEKIIESSDFTSTLTESNQDWKQSLVKLLFLFIAFSKNKEFVEHSSEILIELEKSISEAKNLTLTFYESIEDDLLIKLKI